MTEKEKEILLIEFKEQLKDNNTWPLHSDGINKLFDWICIKIDLKVIEERIKLLKERKAEIQDSVEKLKKLKETFEEIRMPNIWPYWPYPYKQET